MKLNFQGKVKIYFLKLEEFVRKALNLTGKLENFHTATTLTASIEVTYKVAKFS